MSSLLIRIVISKGGSGSGDGDIISSTQELRHGKIVGDEYTLPGQASQGGGKLKWRIRAWEFLVLKEY